MTNEQILKEAIEKAVENGFKYAPYQIQISDGVHPTVIEIPEISIYKHLIFSHDFAKAFWGEELEGINIDAYLRVDDIAINTSPAGACTTFILPKWQYHLQQIVLEEEPLKYLEKFL